VIIQGLEEFKLADDAKDVAVVLRNALHLHSHSKSRQNRMREVCWLLVRRFYASAGRGQMQSSVVGPKPHGTEFRGKRRTDSLIGSPYGNARHVLYISCQQIPRLSPDAALLHFYGGFDAREIMDDTAREAGFLAFLYQHPT